MTNSTQKPTIVSLSPLPTGALSMSLAPFLEGLSVNLLSLVGLNEDEVKLTLGQADVLLGDYTFQIPVNEHTLNMAPRVRFVQQPSVGYQHIDLNACKKRNIPVSNAAGANDKSVAEHTIMLALALLKQFSYFQLKTAAGFWTQSEAFERGVYELSDKKWGIVGMGRIGRELAKRLKPFEVEILYFDAIRLSETEEAQLGIQYAPFEKLMRSADIVSLHVPLTDATRHMINRDILYRMKPSSFLINVARGELVDEEALADALNTRRIAGAGLDVFSQEPISPNSSLLQCKNVVLTPHLAGTTCEARGRIVAVAAKNVVRFLKGEKPINVVNGVL